MIQTLKKYLLISAAIVLSGLSNSVVPVATAAALTENASDNAIEASEKEKGEKKTEENVEVTEEESETSTKNDEKKDEKQSENNNGIPVTETEETPTVKKSEGTTKTTEKKPKEPKVYVCKYVGKPGVNERLKGGKNPIRVSANATSGAEVGEYFNDAQGRSLVVAVYVKGEPAPTCPPAENDEKVRAEKPMKNDLCGTENDTFTVASTEGVKYLLGNTKISGEVSTNNELSVLVTAKAKKGYALKGQTEFTLKFTDKKCKEPKVYVCKYVGKPGVNERLKGGKNPIRVSANATSGAEVGEYFNDAQGRSYVVAIYVKGEAAPTKEDCPPVENDEKVRAVKPTKNDLCGTENDTFTVVKTEGVRYFVGENRVKGKTSTNDELTVVVTAEAKKGYSIKGKTEFTLNFTDKDCVTIKKKAVGFVDNNQSGVVDFGDTVEWKIVVKNKSDTESFYVELTDEMADIEGDSEVMLSPGEKRVFNANSVLMENEIEACEANNTVSFNAYYSYPEWENYSALNLNDAFSLNDSNGQYEGENGNGEHASFSGSASATATFDCPAPGQGGAGTPTTPVTPAFEEGPMVPVYGQGAASELPAELPTTGTVENNLLLLVGVLVSWLPTQVCT